MRKLLITIAALNLGIIGCTGGGEGGGSEEPLVGVWNGYFEAHAFASGSDELAFEIDAVDEATGAVTGRVLLGAGTAPPAATDGDVGYPAGFRLRSSYGLIQEGFEYTLLDATLTGRRFRAGFDPRELWTDWCALQTPYPVSDAPGSSYSCLPSWGYMVSDTFCSQPNPMTGEYVEVDCGKLLLCEAKVCDCDAGGCSVAVAPAVMFDVALDGDIADGSVTGISGALNVRIERN